MAPAVPACERAGVAVDPGGLAAAGFELIPRDRRGSRLGGGEIRVAVTRCERSHRRVPQGPSWLDKRRANRPEGGTAAADRSEDRVPPTLREPGIAIAIQGTGRP